MAMSLGEILEEACKRDLAHKGENCIKYSETLKDDVLTIRLESTLFEESFISCSIPYNGLEAEKNYLRMHFLSMAFNAAILGMKRINKKKIKNINRNNQN